VEMSFVEIAISDNQDNNIILFVQYGGFHRKMHGY